MPAACRSEWAALLEIENDRERRQRLEAYMDKGRGACHLRRPEIASLVDGAFRFYHGQHYEIRAWVVMPNHVHALFKVGTTSMSKIIEDWKTYTAREANQLLAR
ncbi:MAG TPA: transposase, partial [Verrucomicrobiae bacterium]